jgi:L-rhamnose isomerase/sugar isomerase
MPETLIDADLIARANLLHLDGAPGGYAALGAATPAGASMRKRSSRRSAGSASRSRPGASAPEERDSPFPGTGRTPGHLDKIEDCAVIHQLSAPRPRSRSTSLGQGEDVGHLRRRGEALGLGFDAVNSNTFPGPNPDRRCPTSSAASPCGTPTCAPRRSSTTSNAFRIGSELGSKALTVWIGDGANFPGQQHSARAFERYLMRCRRSMPTCRRIGGCSSSTRCTSRPSTPR